MSKIKYTSPGVGFLDQRFINVTGDTMTGTNSTTFFQIQQADTTPVFNVDTTTPQVTMPNNPIIGGFTLTVPATGTTALLNQSNSFTLINPLITIAESWIGPSATAGVYFKGGKVGFGTNAPSAKVQAVGSAFPVLEGVRTTALTDAGTTGISIQHRTTGDMVDGFGAYMGFSIQDDEGTRRNIGFVGAVRAGRDTTGDIYLKPVKNNIVVDGVIVKSNGNVLLGDDFTDTGEKFRVYKVGTQLGLYGGAADYATFAVAADGALTITTVDATAAEGDILLMPDGNVGIGVTDPDTKLEIFKAGNQLKLSFDATDNAIFAVDTAGDLTISPSGSGIITSKTMASAGYKIGATAGVDGSFTTVDSKTVTITKGIITAIV